MAFGRGTRKYTVAARQRERLRSRSRPNETRARLHRRIVRRDGGRRRRWVAIRGGRWRIRRRTASPLAVTMAAPPGHDRRSSAARIPSTARGCFPRRARGSRLTERFSPANTVESEGPRSDATPEWRRFYTTSSCGVLRARGRSSRCRPSTLPAARRRGPRVWRAVPACVAADRLIQTRASRRTGGHARDRALVRCPRRGCCAWRGGPSGATNAMDKVRRLGACATVHVAAARRSCCGVSGAAVRSSSSREGGPSAGAPILVGVGGKPTSLCRRGARRPTARADPVRLCPPAGGGSKRLQASRRRVFGEGGPPNGFRPAPRARGPPTAGAPVRVDPRPTGATSQSRSPGTRRTGPTDITNDHRRRETRSPSGAGVSRGRGTFWP